MVRLAVVGQGGRVEQSRAEGAAAVEMGIWIWIERFALLEREQRRDTRIQGKGTRICLSIHADQI